MATYGPYAGTKFALEAGSDSLRREIAPLCVQAVAVAPGAMRTGLAGRAIAIAHELASTMTPEQSHRYSGLVQAIAAQAASHTESGLPADAAAMVIAKAVTARKPRRATPSAATPRSSPSWRASCPTGCSTAS